MNARARSDFCRRTRSARCVPRLTNARRREIDVGRFNCIPLTVLAGDRGGVRLVNSLVWAAASSYQTAFCQKLLARKRPLTSIEARRQICLVDSCSGDGEPMCGRDDRRPLDNSVLLARRILPRRSNTTIAKLSIAMSYREYLRASHTRNAVEIQNTHQGWVQDVD